MTDTSRCCWTRMAALRRFCCISRLLSMDRSAISLRTTGLIRRPRRSLRNSNATRCRGPQRVAAERPATRAAACSGRWQQEQTRPERLVVHAVEADRASGYVSNVQTASRSSCAHVVTSQSLRCQQTTEQRLGVFMDVARDLARWIFWTALRFEWVYIAVEFAGAIQ